MWALLSFAVRQGFVTTNPISATRPFKVYTDGFHSWIEEEIALFETKQRGGHARVIGPQHIKTKRLLVTQEKTGTTVSLSILAPLVESEWPRDPPRLSFAKRTRETFQSERLRQQVPAMVRCGGTCALPAHGVRKAAPRGFDKAGCSDQQIKAWTGHTAGSEVSRCTATADQSLLSDATAELLMATLTSS